MEKEFDIFGNTELHDRAISELYTGNDIDSLLKDESFSKSILFDVVTPENDIVPAGLVVSCSGEKEELLELFKNDMTVRIQSYGEEFGASRILGEIGNVHATVSDRLGNVGRFVYIKNISLKEGYEDCHSRLSSMVSMLVNNASSSKAIYVTYEDSDVIDILNESLNVKLFTEVGDIKVWGIEV